MILKLSVPNSWFVLSDDQLRFVFNYIAENKTEIAVKTLCLFKWAKLSVAYSEAGVTFIENKGKTYPLTAQQVSDALDSLSWMDGFPPYPVRISKIGKHEAVRADFQGVRFSDYLTIDNLYQGYLQTKREDLLRDITKMIYSGDTENLQPSRAELVSVFYWVSSVKQMFGRMFKHFFREASPDPSFPSVPTYEQLRDSMNSQIRALTGGDITKEQQVLDMDCWRALTELDAKAREADELKSKT